jgi:hypothetical protein
MSFNVKSRGGGRREWRAESEREREREREMRSWTKRRKRGIKG